MLGKVVVDEVRMGFSPAVDLNATAACEVVFIVAFGMITMQDSSVLRQSVSASWSALSCIAIDDHQSGVASLLLFELHQQHAQGWLGDDIGRAEQHFSMFRIDECQGAAQRITHCFPSKPGMQDALGTSLCWQTGVTERCNTALYCVSLSAQADLHLHRQQCHPSCSGMSTAV